MIPRRLRKLFAVVAGALVAGVPVAMIQRGIDAYIERQAADETRLAAQRAIARAEWRIGQSIAALAAIGATRLTSCADIDAEAVRRAVMTTTPIKEIAGRRRGRHAALLAARARRRVRCRANCAPPTIACSSASSCRSRSGERALRIRWQRAGDPLLLLRAYPGGRVPARQPVEQGGSEPVVRVMLNEGTLIAAPFDKHESARRGRRFDQRAQSVDPLSAGRDRDGLARRDVCRACRSARDRTAGGAVLALLIIALALAHSAGAAAPIRLSRWSARSRRGEFVPYYQPLVDLRSGAIVGAEVLMRWRKGDGSLIPPAMFIPLAEVLRPDPRNDQAR